MISDQQHQALLEQDFESMILNNYTDFHSCLAYMSAVGTILADEMAMVIDKVSKQSSCP